MIALLGRSIAGGGMIFVNLAEGKGVNSSVMKYRIFGCEMSYSMYDTI